MFVDLNVGIWIYVFKKFAQIPNFIIDIIHNLFLWIFLVQYNIVAEQCLQLFSDENLTIRLMYYTLLCAFSVLNKSEA